jgi:hypothetical protein
MSGYSIPRTVDADIAGPSAELVGKLVLLRSEGVATIGTTYGPAPATRVTAVEATKKGAQPMGLRLIFWTGVQKTIADADPKFPWVAGRIVVNPQANDPERTFYAMEAPGEADYPLLDTAMAQILTDESPF